MVKRQSAILSPKTSTHPVLRNELVEPLLGHCGRLWAIFHSRVFTAHGDLIDSEESGLSEMESHHCLPSTRLGRRGRVGQAHFHSQLLRWGVCVASVEVVVVVVASSWPSPRRLKRPCTRWPPGKAIEV